MVSGLRTVVNPLMSAAYRSHTSSYAIVDYLVLFRIAGSFLCRQQQAGGKGIENKAKGKQE